MAKQRVMGIPFRDPRVVQFVGDLKKSGCEVAFELTDALGCNAETFYEVPPRVKYKKTAWQTVDILHELLHVRHFYVDGFGMLAWPDESPPTSDVRQSVQHVRDIIDNTVVHRELWREYHFLPISNIFFDECRTDLERGLVGLARNKSGLNHTLLVADRLWMAKMCLSDFGTALAERDRPTCRDFLAHFSGKHHDAEEVVDFLKLLDDAKNLADPKEHEESQVEFVTMLGLPQVQLHISRYDAQKRDFLPSNRSSATA